MLILMNGSLKHVQANRDVIPFGLFLTPLGGLGVSSAFATDMEIGVDNGFFTREDPAGFRRLLGRIPDPARPLFVAAPDRVGDCGATLAMFDLWEPEIHALGFRVALVGQDGFECLAPRQRRPYWDRCEAFFVGGSDAFKLGLFAPALPLIAEARSLGKWVHFGRVNSVSRINFCERIGCDSVDGSGIVRTSRDKIPRIRRYYERKKDMPILGAWS